MLYVDIEPVQVYLDDAMPRLTSLRITPEDIMFNEKIDFNVEVMTSGRSVYKSQIVIFDGELYKKWKGSDQYLVDIICQMLGYVEKDRDSKTGKFSVYEPPTLLVEDIPSDMSVEDIPSDVNIDV